MKVLVTGPDGLLGSNVVRELLAQNYEVLVMSEDGKDSPTIDDLPIQKIAGNLLKPTEIDQAINGATYVIHCAASTKMFPPKSELVNKINIDGTQAIINACLKHNVKRLVYIGTANSFESGTKEAPGDELNGYMGAKYGVDYMDSKYKAQCLIQRACKEDGLNAVVINPTYMIGPYDSTPSSGTMVLKIQAEKVPGYTLGGKNFVAVKDVAKAVVNALTMGRSGECYIAGNENLTYHEAFQKIANTLGVKAPKTKMTTPMVRLFGTVNSKLATLFKFEPKITKELAILASEEHYYSNKKARTELQMPQTDIEEAILDCFTWFQENGYVKK